MKDRIIDRIKKCLRLAQSANEHEAAAALRQAQKLMQQHGITAFEVEHADVQEEAARAGASRRPARWECALASTVASAFGCDVFLSMGLESGRWVFVGIEPSGEIARYAFQVLFRQAKRARKQYIQTVLRRCTTTRTRRADMFCEGWVASATSLVEQSGTPPKVTAYLQRKHSLQELKPSARTGDTSSARNVADWYAGHASGKDAQLRRGVNGSGARRALKGPAATTAA